MPELMTNPSKYLLDVKNRAEKVALDVGTWLRSNIKLLYKFITADGHLWKQQFIFVDLVFLYLAISPCLMLGCV